MQYDPYNSPAMNAMAQGAAGNLPQNSPADSRFANSASMNPTAMQNLMGNPMGNDGSNLTPFLESQQKMMLNRSAGPTYARGGYVHGGYVDMDSQAEAPHMNPQLYSHGGMVHMQAGGNPMDAMNQQGGLAQAAMAEEGGDDYVEDQEDYPLAALAQEVDNLDGMQLTFINAEEHEALMQATGEEIPLAEEVSDNPEAIAQLMQGAEGDDYALVYLTQEQFSFLVENFGEPSINDASGLPQFFKKAFKRILKNPIVQALAPIALNAIAPGVGSAIGGALGLGSMGTSALLGGGMGLLGGGGIKGALKGAALGGLGQLGGEYLSSGTNPFSGMFGGSQQMPGSGFGLTGNSAGSGGVGGINPASATPGLNPAVNSSSLTPGANALAGARKSGLASLIPDSLMGKLGLAAAGTALLGAGGPKPQDQGMPQQAGVTDPNFNRPLEQQMLVRTKRPEFRPDYTIAQDAGERTYFDDQFLPVVPKAARHGGLMQAYASGGAISNYDRIRPRIVGSGPTADGERLRQEISGPMSDFDRRKRAQPYAAGGVTSGPTYNDAVHQQLYAMALPSAPLPNPVGGSMPAMPMNRGMGMSSPNQAMNPMGAPPMMGGLQQAYAHGGMTYDNGGLLNGRGDGVSDSIPATIGGKQPARLSGGEFVLPARVVSELGNGSSEAGADRLYQFMEKVQSGMRKNRDIAKNTRAYKHLPA